MANGTLTRNEIDKIIDNFQNPSPQLSKDQIDNIIDSFQNTSPKTASVPAARKVKQKSAPSLEEARMIGAQALKDAQAGKLSKPYSESELTGYSEIPSLKQTEYTRSGYSPNEIRAMEEALYGKARADAQQQSRMLEKNAARNRDRKREVTELSDADRAKVDELENKIKSLRNTPTTGDVAIDDIAQTNNVQDIRKYQKQLDDIYNLARMSDNEKIDYLVDPTRKLTKQEKAVAKDIMRQYDIDNPTPGQTDERMNALRDKISSSSNLIYGAFNGIPGLDAGMTAADTNYYGWSLDDLRSEAEKSNAVLTDEEQATINQLQSEIQQLQAGLGQSMSTGDAGVDEAIGISNDNNIRRQIGEKQAQIYKTILDHGKEPTYGYKQRKQAAQTQDMGAYMAGDMATRALFTALGQKALGNTGYGEALNNIFGDSTAGKIMADALADAPIDLATDTLPEYLSNKASGMSQDELNKRLALNVGLNGLIDTGVAGAQNADELIPSLTNGFNKLKNFFRRTDKNAAEDVTDAITDTVRQNADEVADVAQTAEEVKNTAGQLPELSEADLNASTNPDDYTLVSSTNRKGKESYTIKQADGTDVEEFKGQKFNTPLEAQSALNNYITKLENGPEVSPEEALKIAQENLKNAEFNTIPIERRRELLDDYIKDELNQKYNDIAGLSDDDWHNAIKDRTAYTGKNNTSKLEYKWMEDTYLDPLTDMERRDKFVRDFAKNNFEDDFLTNLDNLKQDGKYASDIMRQAADMDYFDEEALSKYAPLMDDLLERMGKAKTKEEVDDIFRDAALLYGKMNNLMSGAKYVMLDDTLKPDIDKFVRAFDGVTIKLPKQLTSNFTDMRMKDFNNIFSGFGNRPRNFKFTRGTKGDGMTIDQLFDQLNDATGGMLMSFAQDAGNPDLDATQMQAIINYADWLKGRDKYLEYDYDNDLFEGWREEFNNALANANKRIIGSRSIEDLPVNIYPYTRPGKNVEGVIPDGEQVLPGGKRYGQGPGVIADDYDSHLVEKGNGEHQISKYRTNTMEKTGIVNQDNAPIEDYGYDTWTAEQQLEEGTRRWGKDPDAAQNLAKTDNWDAADARYAQKLWQEYLESDDPVKQHLAERLSRKQSYELREGGRLIQTADEIKAETVAGKLAQAQQLLNKHVDHQRGAGTSEALDNFITQLENEFEKQSLLDYDLTFFGNKEKVIQIIQDMAKKGMGAYAPTNKNIGNMKFMGVNKILDDIRSGHINSVDALSEAFYKQNKGAYINAKNQKQIYDILTEASQLQEGTREQEKLLAQAAKLATKGMPVSLGNKVRSILYANMLGNFKTAISRNAFGNAAYNVLEQTRSPLAAGIDALVSKKTGQRSTLGWNKEKFKAYGQGFKKGASDQLSDIKLRVNTGRNGSMGWVNALKENSPTWNADTNSEVRNKFAEFANQTEKYVSDAMKLGDRPFFEANFEQRRKELEQLIERFGKEGVAGLEEVPDEAVDDTINLIASLHAADAVFQKQGKMAEGLTQIRQGIANASRGALGVDVLSTAVSPFTLTPGNMVEKAIEYSPLGLIKNSITTGKELANGTFNQRRFVDELSRTIEGSALLGGAYGLAKNGHINGGYSEDPDEKAAQIADDFIEYGLKIGDTAFDASDIPVLGQFIQAAGAVNEKGFTPEALGQAVDAVTMGSAMQGFRKAFGGDSKYSTSGSLGKSLKDTFLSSGTQLIPSLARQTAQTIDPYKRDLGEYGTPQYYLNLMRNSDPVGRLSLPVKTDNEGNPVLQNQGRNIGSKILENYFAPMNVRTYNPSDLTKEATRLNDPNVAASNAGFAPTPKRSDLRKWDEQAGKEYSEEQFRTYSNLNKKLDGDVGERFIKDDIYKSLSPTDQAKALGEIYAAMKQVSKKVATGLDTDDKLAKAYMSGGRTADEQYNALTEKIEAKYNKYGLDPDVYQTMKDEGTDFTPYEGYKEAKQQLGIETDSADFRKAYAEGKTEGLQKEADYQQALKDNGLSDSGVNRQAFDADPQNGLQQIVQKKQTATNIGFVTSDGKANTAEYDKAVSVIGNDETKLSNYSQLKADVTSKGLTKVDDYIPYVKSHSGDDNTKGQYAMLLAGDTPDNIQGKGAKAAYDDGGYAGYWYYRELQTLQNDYNNDGKVNKYDRIQKLYEDGYGQGSDKFELYSKLSY